MKTTIIYKGITISCLLSGWYSCKTNVTGYLKADTLPGIKKLINHAINNYGTFK